MSIAELSTWQQQRQQELQLAEATFHAQQLQRAATYEMGKSLWQKNELKQLIERIQLDIWRTEQVLKRRQEEHASQHHDREADSDDDIVIHDAPPDSADVRVSKVQRNT